MYTLSKLNLTQNQIKWLNHYNNLMVKNKNTRKIKGETARHHSVPESFFINRTRNTNKPGHLAGNPDALENLVFLSHRAHFIAHQLLTKIYPTNQAMTYAAHLMRGNIKNGKEYSWLKNQYSTMLSSDDPIIKEMFKKIGKHQIGDKNVSKRPEVRAKIAASLTGKKASPEAIEKIRLFRKGKNKHNYEPIARMAQTMSKVMTGLTKENSQMRQNHSKSLSVSMTGKTKETCPRLATASKTLTETMSKLKRVD